MLHVRVAKRYLLEEIQRLLGEFDSKVVRPIARSPGHAGAVLDGLNLVNEILNAFDEAELEGLDRPLYVTRNFWQGQATKEQSNDWFRETGEYLETFPALVQKWLDKAKAQFEVKLGPVVIEGIRVRNVTGHPDAVEDVRRPLEVAAKAIKGRRWGSLLRSDLKLVQERQMPPMQRGHAGALYRSGSDDIFVMWPPIDDRDLVERLVHEFGHRLWFKFLDLVYREEWAQSWQELKSGGGRFISRYAATDPKEDFAEVFMHWALKRPLRGHEERLRGVGIA